MRLVAALVLAGAVVLLGLGGLAWYTRAHDPRRVCEGHLRTLLKASDRVTAQMSHWVWAALIDHDDNQFRYMFKQADMGPRDWRCPLDPNPSREQASYCLNPAAFRRDDQGQPTGNLSDDTADGEFPFLLERGCFHDGKALAISRHGDILVLTPDQLRGICVPRPSPTP